MNSNELKVFETLETPFYHYDVPLLRETLTALKAAADQRDYKVHYALKANSNDRILQEIRKAGLGADCVSGQEVQAAVRNGFSSEKIVFAGVGKSDREIRYGLDHNIFCFNCESIQELSVLDALAKEEGKRARIALRINPDVDPNTHHYITTGLEENKFGINTWELDETLRVLEELEYVELVGLHFHIGSQITTLKPFKDLCNRVNEIQKWFHNRQIIPQHINVGGGLGINYDDPDQHAIPDFEAYFGLFEQFLNLRPSQELHFELGRAITGQCGRLISRVLYIKEGIKTNFAILDAGMTELIRPALYQSVHRIENLSKQQKRLRESDQMKYDVVGPICESSDCFGKAVDLPRSERGDLFAIRSAGAYGEVMASRYNLRELPKAYYSDELTA